MARDITQTTGTRSSFKMYTFGKPEVMLILQAYALASVEKRTRRRHEKGSKSKLEKPG